MNTLKLGKTVGQQLAIFIASEQQKMIHIVFLDYSTLLHTLSKPGSSLMLPQLDMFFQLV